ncbi:MAG: hypothetical protein E6G41_07900 [Actinobacteria bacterium]|nr:MAG: hypothetical protein E6G41_07900 [Actinomycetota bacterium]
MSSTRLAALLATLSLAAVPAGAGAKLDYSMNSVNGQYAPPATQQINDVPSASEPAPSQVTASPAARTVVVAQSATGFSWGDALIGASAALLVAFAGITLVRRRHATPLAG